MADLAGHTVWQMKQSRPEMLNSSSANPGASTKTLIVPRGTLSFFPSTVSPSDLAIWRRVLNVLQYPFLWHPVWQASRKEVPMSLVQFLRHFRCYRRRQNLKRLDALTAGWL